MAIFRQLPILTISGNCPKIAFGMFGDLYDALSFLWSWRWPVAQGDITAVDVERVQRGRDTTYRLAVAYEFSLRRGWPLHWGILLATRIPSKNKGAEEGEGVPPPPTCYGEISSR